MRKLQLALLLAGLALFGCDDSNDGGSSCSKECGHGSCQLKVTMEYCTCEPGYKTDGAGACTLFDDPKLVLRNKPVIENGKVSFQVELVDPENKLSNVALVLKRDGEIVRNQMGKSIDVSDDMGGNKKAGYTISVLPDNGIEPIFLPIWNEEKAWDWRNAVIYFAFIDRFSNGNTANDRPLGIANDWMGGDFAGLKARVEEGYFDSLGVNTIWISSVSMNTQSAYGTSCAYHSYWPLTTGYTDETASMFNGYTSNGVAITPIEPHFGTMEELKALVKACHNRGIRVLVDFAANHVDQESPVFKLHPEWFNYGDYVEKDSILCEGPKDENGEDTNNNRNWIPETCWFSDNLPDFNYNLPEVRSFVIDHAKWLIKTTGIDGFRMDAVKHMPMVFTSDFRAAIDDLYANTDDIFYLIGETFDGAPTIKKYIGNTMLHGQFDFEQYWKLRDSIMNGDSKFTTLSNYVVTGDSLYGDALMSAFLGNHDVERAISYIHHDPDSKKLQNPEVTETWAYRQLRLAWVYLMTSPMIPMIYYGDEYGLEGSNDPDNRRMMEFGNQLNAEQQKTLALVQQLGKLRHEHPAMWRGKRQNVGANDRSYMYVMRDGDETILVGISDSDDPQTYDLTKAGISEGANGWIDLLNDNAGVSETTSVTLTFERQWIVWKAK